MINAEEGKIFSKIFQPAAFESFLHDVKKNKINIIVYYLFKSLCQSSRFQTDF